MGLRSSFRKIIARRHDLGAVIDDVAPEVTADGHDLILTYSADLIDLHASESSQDLQHQMAVLEMLEEGGLAKRSGSEYRIPHEYAGRLDEDTAQLLGLPPRFPGKFNTQSTSHTQSKNFDFRVEVIRDRYSERFTRQGGLLTVGTGERRATYRLTTPLLHAFEGLDRFHSKETGQRTTQDNERLVTDLLLAREEHQGLSHLLSDPDEDIQEEQGPFPIDLSHFSDSRAFRPPSVRVTVEELPDGGLRLSPNYQTGHEPEALDARLHQLDSGTRTLRVENDLIHLAEDSVLKGTQNLRRNSHVPAEHVETFYAAPAEYLGDGVEIDWFSTRVSGVGKIEPIPFTEQSTGTVQWFSEVEEVLSPASLPNFVETPDDLLVIEDAVERALERDATLLPLPKHDAVIDISDAEAVATTLTKIRADLDHATRPEEGSPERTSVSLIVRDVEQTDAPAVDDTTDLPAEALAGLAYTPYQHQQDGIRWLLHRMESALGPSSDTAARVQGALLADDMGLGKTFMTLVALREFARQVKGHHVGDRPHLLVVPLTLVENWQSEMHSSFLHTPFDDVVVLHGEGLRRFRRQGAGAETQVGAGTVDEAGLAKTNELKLSLVVGEGHPSAARLDRPGRLIITTYETLARYQLSLATIEWGVVIFDEAQDIKNPDTLRARAAKGLKAMFKLVATGTPVENSLRDLWSLMDTAQPGLLGSWLEFKRDWVKPVQGAESPHAKAEIGQRLAAHLSDYMLHRTKEDHLPGLPPKTIHADIEFVMPPPQRRRYDQVMAEMTSLGGRPGAALTALQQLRAVSLHPQATASQTDSTDVAWEESGRTLALMQILDQVRRAEEKAIIFVINKKVQRHLKVWLQQKYGISVSIINGDTATQGSVGTRHEMIRSFQDSDGFNIIVMSPVAAGRGLTVTAANHAIHLERHWNPAKEAQATDRIYRIGQRRPVHVYMPKAIHPDQEIISFDQSLHQLLEQKTQLKNAVVVPEAVTDQELLTSLSSPET